MSARILLSHVSAFEYWRIVGMRGVIVPAKTNINLAPTPQSVDLSVWRAARVGSLSLPIHCLASKKRKPQSFVTYHFASRTLPRGSVYCISDGVHIVSPELVLLQIASLVSVVELAGLMTEFCGHYSPAEFEHFGLVNRHPLTTLAKLKTFGEKAAHYNGLEKFRQAVSYAFDQSRSPMETGLALLLSLPPRFGGYSLGQLELNKRIKLKEPDREALGVDELCPDICWPARKVCIEYDSTDFHASAERVVNDARRKNAFVAADYRLMTFTKAQLQSWNKTDTLAFQLSKYLGKRIDFTAEKNRGVLRRQLFSIHSVLKQQYGVSMRVGQGVVRLSDLSS